MARKEQDGYVKDPAAIAKKIHVPTYDEILERIKSRYPRGRGSLFDKQLATLQRTYDIVITKTNFVRDLVRLLDGLHPFYWALIEIEFDRDRIHKSISCVSKARRLAGKFFEKYRVLLMAAENKRELLRVASEGRGRILSGIKKCRRSLDYLRNLVVFIQHLPTIDATLPTIIVAGAPSTGKSTFVRSVSRARPEVASYPFTTTTIHIGHFYVGDDKIQVIDTPGLLDRPVEAMNPVEKRAVAALSLLDGSILFLVDVSKDAYMNVDEQFRLLKRVLEFAQGKPVYAALNKVDAADPAMLEEARRRLALYQDKGVVTRIYEMVAEDPESARSVAEDIARDMLARRKPSA